MHLRSGCTCARPYIVFDTSTPSTAWVLHIASGSAALAARADTQLRAHGFVVERCGDVYRGLARLHPRHERRPVAIVVGVDGLGGAELEFFRIVGRLPRTLPAFVYAEAVSQKKVERALELGATARLSDEALAALRAALSVHHAPVEASTATTMRDAAAPAVAAPYPPTTAPTERIAKPPPAAASTTPVAPVPGAPAPPAGGEDAEPELEEPASEEPELEEDTDEITRPVRVPWLRGSEEPVRQPPSRGRRAAAEPKRTPGEQPSKGSPAASTRGAQNAPDEARRVEPPSHPAEAVPPPTAASRTQPADDERGFAPLLTDEEWNALLKRDDDISSIVPPDPDERCEIP